MVAKIKEDEMRTRWFAWFQTGEGKEPFFRVLASRDISGAEMMANDLAYRDKVVLIGVIGASGQFNSSEK